MYRIAETMTQPAAQTAAGFDTEEAWIVCRVPKAEICYFRYTLEAYEGLCVPTTLPGGQGAVRLLTSRALVGELEETLAALSLEIDLQVLEKGEGSPQEESGWRGPEHT